MGEQDGTHSEPKEASGDVRGLDHKKAPWERPGFERIGADEAETGINPGPEILILIS